MHRMPPMHERLRERLSQPGAFPEGGPVEVRETHISVVFLTPQHAWKLLKPVQFDFLDFSTCEARHAECCNEVRLNRRLAPNVYLDVVPVTQPESSPLSESEEEAEQTELTVGGSGQPVDWLIKMQRLPDDATLEARIEQGTAGERELETLLDVLVPFFEASERGPGISTSGESSTLRQNVLENVSAFETCAPPTADVTVLRSMQLQYLAAHEALFRERVKQEWIRDGHGDLRAEHVYFTDPPVIVDCIAFNDRFRQADVLDEICFLATDLQRLGRDDLATYLVNRYRQRMDDPAPDSLAGYFQSYRYSVRAKVACLRVGEQSGTDKTDSLQQAAALIQRAVAALQPYHRPWCIVFCGVSGSGKSTVARLLAEQVGAVRLASDVIRKELHGVHPADHTADPELYSRRANERTYATLLEQAGEWLQRGASVLLDATFGRRADRERAKAQAEEFGGRFLLVELRIAAAVAEQRIRDRQTSENDVSDADVAVLKQQLQRFEPPGETPASQRLSAEAGRSAEEVCRQIVSRLSVV